MKKIYLLSENFIKNNTPINLNVEPYLINLAILDSQALKIQQALGTPLYNKILSLVEDGTIDSNIPYKTLLNEYIQPALLHWVIVESLPYIRYKIMNKSVSSQDSENASPITNDELRYMIREITNKAEFYTERLVSFLKEDCGKIYTEYKETTKQLKPQKSAYFSGIQF